jgi:hypothetical protein
MQNPGHYIDLYFQAEMAGDIQEMKHHLEMLSTASRLDIMRERLKNTEPWFQGLVPNEDTSIFNWYKRLTVFQSQRKWCPPIVKALVDANMNAYIWERWFLDPKTRAANCIKRAWRKAIDNPNTEVGKNHLRRDFENFQVKFSSDFV